MPSPETSEKISTAETSPATESLPRAKGHKPGCACPFCKRIQKLHAVSQALPPEKRRSRASPAQIRRARFAQAITLPGKVTFANPTKAAESVGLSPNSAHSMMANSQVQSLILKALSDNGITASEVARKAKEGFEAYDSRVITTKDSEGRSIHDVVKVPDFSAQHKFWRDVCMMMGFLGSEKDAAPGTGGLILINVENALVKGHAAMCPCDECVSAWDVMTKKVAAQQQQRAQTIEAELIGEADAPPAPIFSKDDGEEPQR